MKIRLLGKNSIHQSKRVLVSVLCGKDFERTKYVLNSVIAQTGTDFELIVLGRRSYIDSFESLFEILNYSKVKSNVFCKFSDSSESIDMLSLIQRNAIEGNYDYVVVLPPNVALYSNDSLAKILDYTSKHPRDYYSFSSAEIIDEKYVGETEFGPIVVSTAILKTGKKTFGQYSINRHKEETKVKNSGRSIIKIVMFVTSFSIWPSLKTLYDAAINDSRVEIKLVHVHNTHVNADEEIVLNEIKIFKENGVDVISSSAYDLDQDNPDIAIYGLPYSTIEKRFTIDEVSKRVRRCVYIPYGFTLNSNWDELVRLRYKIAMMYLAWLVFYADDSELEYARKHVYGAGDNLVSIGIPRIDLIKNLDAKSYPEYTTMINCFAKGRKIGLWNTHHSIDAGENSFSSWKVMGESIIEYIKSQNDVYFIWRPHPYFAEALRKYLGDARFDNFLRDIEAIDNLYIDKEETYLKSFSVADFFISDASSLVKEFLFMDKPVIVTVSDKTIVDESNPVTCFDICSSPTEFICKIEEITRGLDIHKVDRKKYISQGLQNDITVGEKLLDYIMEKYYEEH